MVTMVPGQGGRFQSVCFPEQPLLERLYTQDTFWELGWSSLSSVTSFCSVWVEACLPEQKSLFTWSNSRYSVPETSIYPCKNSNLGWNCWPLTEIKQTGPNRRPKRMVISSVQLFSHVQLFVAPWTAARQAFLSITNSWILLKPCLLSQGCHPTISSSVVLFSSCLQSFPWPSLALEREGNIWGKGCRVYDFLLIGCWLWANRVVLQESCAQPEVTILHLGGDPSSAKELKDTVKCISWVEIRTLPQGCTIILLLLLSFRIPFLPWSAIVWICPLGLRKGQGGWMKPTSYKQETENIEWIYTPEPHWILLSFNSGNWATMTLITSWQNGA